MAGRTGVTLGLEFIYLTENKTIIGGFGHEAPAAIVRRDRWKSGEIGKCFHTWNMGFPLPEGAGRRQF
jgi:hypothetical protein